MEELLEKIKKLDIDEDKNYIYYDELENKSGKRYEHIINNNIDISDFSSHSPSCSKLYDVLINLNISNKDSILDIGSGKGYALFIFSLFDFNEICGVEINKTDNDICKKNLEKLDLNKKIKIINDDILNFKKFNSYNYFYFYNPFGEEIFRKIINILSKIKNITIIYKNVHKNDILILSENNLHVYDMVEGDGRDYYIFRNF